MSANLIYPAPQIPPAEALRMSQEAPQLLQTSPNGSLPYPLSLLASPETQDAWLAHENLMLSCLRTGDDKSAKLCLDRLMARFGESNERVMALKGIYEEAVAENDQALEKILRSYEELLQHDPTNMPIRKRRIALLKSMSKASEAISTLTELLDFSPVDAEAWAELSELYFSQGAYQQAMFSLEEVLLIMPNAWNVSSYICWPQLRY